MELMKGFTDEQVREIAQQPTPKPMPGVWMLIGPDGRTWRGDSPLQCVAAEIRDRVPLEIALARIRVSILNAEDECARSVTPNAAHKRQAKEE